MFKGMQFVLCACLAASATAAAVSPPEISWNGGRTKFDIVQSMALRSGRLADIDNGKFIAKQCQPNQAAIKRPELALHDVYDVYSALGNGVLARIRQGIHRISRNKYAIKTIDLSTIRADQRETLRREANIMKTLDQPDMIKLHETFEETDKLHLVLEFREGADALEYTVAVDLFEYIVLKTSVLYSPHHATIKNRHGRS